MFSIFSCGSFCTACRSDKGDPCFFSTMFFLTEIKYPNPRSSAQKPVLVLVFLQRPELPLSLCPLRDERRAPLLARPRGGRVQDGRGARDIRGREVPRRAAFGTHGRPGEEKAAVFSIFTFHFWSTMRCYGFLFQRTGPRDCKKHIILCGSAA